MKVGILSVPVRDMPIEEMIAWAASIGVQQIELNVEPGGNFDATTVTDADIANLKALLAKHNISLSAVVCYWFSMMTGVSDEHRAKSKEVFAAAIKLAAKLDVNMVGALAGFPTPGKDRNKTMREDLPEHMRPMVDLAKQHGVKIMFENWYATNLQNLENFATLFEVFPDAHMGLNYDPSHLDWQEIDYIDGVREFKDRIFHVHAKDVWVNPTIRARIGTNASGWWRYVLPGYGRIRWGEFITTLRKVGYDGVISVEHEDDAFGAQEGFVKSVRYLRALTD
ncbi:MAG: sugar phosphate isomerase/epimerase family protein [Roseiflexaceae bacterium]